MTVGQVTRFATMDIFYAHLNILQFINEGSENVLRTEALSKYYSVLSLPPCCSFTEVISFRPPTMSPADQQKKRSYDRAMMSPADRREQKRSYDQRLVNCACSLSYCKRTVTSTTRRKHRKKMREIASTQGDVAQDDGKDKKDGKVFILLSTTSYRWQRMQRVGRRQMGKVLSSELLSRQK